MNTPLFMALREQRFMLLFVFTLLMLISLAVFSDAIVINVVITLLYLNALLTALSASGASQRLRYGFLLLWAVTAILKFAPAPGMESLCLLLGKGLGCLLLLILVFSIMRFVMFSRSIESDTLFAAVVAYMLLAIMFGQLYSLISFMVPDAFSISKALLTDEMYASDIDYYYFSFITIATLGYGDITPAHPFTQILASIEAVIGQFYVAIIVAWLVSVYVANHQDRK